MTSSSVIRWTFAVLAMAAGGAFAQSKTAVMTDVSLPPAEERDSVGAVVLETSMVRAQKKVALTRSGPARVAAVGREMDRATRADQTREDLKQAREEDALRLHEMGAGALDGH